MAGIVNIGDQYLSEADKAKIQKYKNDWAAATASGDAQAADKAHINAESVRARNGYVSTGDGSKYVAVAPRAVGAGSTASYAPGVGWGESGADYLDGIYNAQQAAELAALERLYRSNLASLDGEKAQLEPTYTAARNQIAAEAERAGQSWNEYAAAAGLNSGASGQAALARGNLYQSGMAKLAGAQLAATAQIERRRQELAAGYSAAIEQANAESNSARARALYDEYVRRDKLAYQRQQDALEQQNYERQSAYSASQDAYAKRLKLAQLAAGYGDDSYLRALME